VKNIEILGHELIEYIIMNIKISLKYLLASESQYNLGLLDFLFSVFLDFM